MYKIVSRKARSIFSSLRNRLVERTLHILPEPTAKVYDCFLFNNELDILRLRLIELYSCVDYFVICECGVTFSGESKPLHYLLNQDQFARFQDKVLHFVIPDPPAEVYTENPINPNQKTSQFWQRNQMALAIKPANKNDLILISDVDEIPRANVLPHVSKICKFSNSIVFFSQAWYLLFLDVRVDQRDQVVFASNRRTKNPNNAKWLGTYACTAELLRKRYMGDVNRVWAMKWGDYQFDHLIVEHAGWHFSYMGGMKGLLTKIQANGMKPYTNKHVQDLQQGRFIDCLLSIETIAQNHPQELKDHPQSWNHLMIQHNSLMELATELESFLSNHEANES
jgi:beta-1,4-mannosyl-glycoprotein beta-1,4-N-acetylglucosaminyltransferase